MAWFSGLFGSQPQLRELPYYSAALAAESVLLGIGKERYNPLGATRSSSPHTTVYDVPIATPFDAETKGDWIHSA